MVNLEEQKETFGPLFAFLYGKGELNDYLREVKEYHQTDDPLFIITVITSDPHLYISMTFSWNNQKWARIHSEYQDFLDSRNTI